MSSWLKKGLALGAAVAMLGGLQISLADEADARRYKGRHLHGHHHLKHHHRGRNIARGVAIGVGTAIVIDSITRTRYSCKELRYMCSDGNDWACRKHRDRC